jgi:hypothetical protein
MSRNLVRGVVFLTAIAVALPPPSFTQPKPVPVAETGATEFNVEQLDAMLAPIALYPDELLTQTLMASTYPLQVVAASRWLENSGCGARPRRPAASKRPNSSVSLCRKIRS